MTKYFKSMLFLLVIFQLISSFLALASELPGHKATLVKEPEEHYYLVKNKPAHIVCQAENAEEIIYTCMGTQIPEDSVEMDGVSEINPSLIQARLEVKRADVQNHVGDAPFWCTCSAVDVGGQVSATSRRGYVYIAHLKNKFVVQPKNITASVGENVELACGAPDGLPKPKIVWEKDNKRINAQNSPDKIVTDLGNLVIKSASNGDSGWYKCFARNIAGSRESDSAYLLVMALEEMAEPSVMLSEDDEDSKNAAEAIKPRTTRESIKKTYFIIEPQERSYITEDKPLLLDCAVAVADIVTFSCNGKRVPREQQTIEQGLDAAGNRNVQSQLKINYADVEAFQTEFGDTKTYQCICNAYFQDSGTPSGWGRLDTHEGLGYVVLAYLDSVFQKDPSDITTAIGTDATLTCESPKGQPHPQVYWYKEGSRLGSHNRYISDNKGHLVIHNVQSEDAGQYNCVAQNSVKSVQSKVARLTVSADAPVMTTAAYSSEDHVPDFPAVIPSSPVFLIDLQPEYTLEKGGAKTIVCAAMSADRMTVECGGKRLSAEEYELKSKLHKETGKRLWYTKTVVSAEKVEAHPDGYFCQCTAWHINEQKIWARVMGSRGNFKLITSRMYIGDQFAIMPKDTDVYLESDVEFECSPPEGNPPPSVHWLKDGVQIDTVADSNYVILKDGKLIIEYVHSTDEGLYICVAENEVGTMFSKAAKLTVLNKHEQTSIEEVTPEITTPSIETTTSHDPVYSLTEPIFSLEPSSENYIIKDQPVNLTCTVIAATSVLFVCNGQVLRETDLTAIHYRHPETQSSIHENFLIITKEKVETQKGSEPYTCTCRAYYQKEGGDPTQLEFIDSSPAVVEVAYLKNRFLQEPADTQVPYLGRAELICKPPNGNPEPQIHWLKDGFRLFQDQRIQFEYSGNLIINGFIREDEGAYTCVAENLVRSRTSQTAIITLADENVETGTKPESGHMPDIAQPETSTEQSVDMQHEDLPHISVDLEPFYDLVDNKPATLICGAYDVEFVTITCGMQKVEDLLIMERMQSVALPNRQVKLVKVIEASINVSKSDVENYGSRQVYYCLCHGHYLVPGERDYRVIDSNKGVVRIEKNEVSECDRHRAYCSSQLNENTPLKEFCSALPDYVRCVDSYLDKCALKLSKSAIDDLRKAENDGRTKCSIESQCPEMERCRRAPDSGLTVDDFCLDEDNMILCTRRALAECNAALFPLAQKEYEDFLKVLDWYINYCYSFFKISQSLASCDMTEACDTYITQLQETENSTNWCKFINPLAECTRDAVNTCDLDELRYNLQNLFSESAVLICSEDDEKETNGDHSTAVAPEPEGEAAPEEGGDSEPMGETKPAITGDSDDDNEGDGDDGDDTMEKGTAAAKETMGSGSMLCTSVLLVTILQLLMMSLR